MFTYAIRIFEYFHQFPTSLAILCDGSPKWRPTHYGVTTPGSRLQFDFTAVKLLDYQTQWNQLEASRNPFAVIVMAHLKTQETKGHANNRKAWKLTLIKRLYSLGYSRSDILNLFTFIDWVMILPKGLERVFWNELTTYEEERQMPYVTTGERIGMEKGMEKATKAIALNLLNQGIAIDAIAQATSLTVAQLQKLQAENR